MFFVKVFFFFFFLHIACSDIHAPKYSWDNESFVKVLVGKVLSKFTTKSDILKLFLWGLNQSESRTRTIHFININCKYLVIYKYLVNKYFVRYFASDYKNVVCQSTLLCHFSCVSTVISHIWSSGNGFKTAWLQNWESICKKLELLYVFWIFVYLFGLLIHERPLALSHWLSLLDWPWQNYTLCMWITNTVPNEFCRTMAKSWFKDHRAGYSIESSGV